MRQANMKVSDAEKQYINITEGATKRALDIGSMARLFIITAAPASMDRGVNRPSRGCYPHVPESCSLFEMRPNRTTTGRGASRRRYKMRESLSPAHSCPFTARITTPFWISG